MSCPCLHPPIQDLAPDVQAYNCVIKACANARPARTRTAFGVLARMEASGWVQ